MTHNGGSACILDNGDTSEEFVTVVAVGAKEAIASTDCPPPPDFVTVLKIGENEVVVVEQVLVYRLPGERLGFGLKFEGGTKASEFVKRLFIQSCAPDSPASRVRGSWGALAEGDQVLEIDGRPVRAMTRIDCVRCLKDSNVVIHLLVKHRRTPDVLDLPQVISAEKKRMVQCPPPPPPPPPPVPPRKVPRKKDANMNTKSTKSEVVKRVRKLSEGSVGPPEADVYTDLLAHDSPNCLSESDDTASTISTIIDRLASFPTTTTSSFAGSLPSTPTATPTVRKRMSLSSKPMDADSIDQNENYLYSKLESLQADYQQTIDVPDGTMAPPGYFRDAPLSYADEEVCMHTNIIKIESDSAPPPPPPPRKREKNNNDYRVPNENRRSETLPRLVDFVPKTIRVEAPIEQYEPSNVRAADGGELFDYNWHPGAPLATIGEDVEEDVADRQDEEPCHDDDDQRIPNCSRALTVTMPIVVVDKVHTSDDEIQLDTDEILDSAQQQRDISDQFTPAPAPRHCPPSLTKSNATIMDTPAISTRQPPDGHEFPDYVERVKRAPPLAKTRATTTPNVKSIIAMFSTPVPSGEDGGGGGSTPSKPVVIPSSFQPGVVPGVVLKRASLDLTSPSPPPVPHKRSQSLIDLSDGLHLPASDRWSQLLEQRRRGLSKLKGLVISEHPDCDTRVIDLPEIRSTPDAFIATLKSPTLPPPPPPPHPDHLLQPSATIPSGITPLWHVQEAVKYSPAFKRRSLQICSKPTARIPDEESPCSARDASEPPKSLESITSPTRSDSSFEYISSSSPELLKTNTAPKTPKKTLEDESDNDSALSSSQSSYISRYSPRCSPIHLLNDHHASDTTDLSNRRLLKAQSVEAINRKNILASAKCRSGRDFNGGSPLIQRKFEESSQLEEDQVPEDKKPLPNGSVKVSETSVNVPRIPSCPESAKSARNHAESKFSSARLQNTKQVSVTDLRRNFEKATGLSSGPKTPGGVPNSKLTRGDGISSTKTKRHSLPGLSSANPSIPSNTLTSKEVEQIVAKTVAEWKEALNRDELKVVGLRPDILGSSVGVTLAGGTDYETKDITIHKVRSGSAAHRDGRLQKGDRVLAINGTCMIGLTHAQSLAVLKEPVLDTILVTYPGRTPLTRSTSLFDMPQSDLTSNIVKLTKKDKTQKSMKLNHIVVKLMKNAASGLGFSMEGGKDSPQGDVPLVIKKLFTGGIAAKCGELEIGDEVLEINGIDVAGMSRIDAWTLIKKIPPGEVVLRVQRR